MARGCVQAGECYCVCEQCRSIRQGYPGAYEHCELHMDDCHAECSSRRR